MVPSELLQDFPIAIYLWHPAQCQYCSVPTKKCFLSDFGVESPFLSLAVNKFRKSFPDIQL